MSMAIEYGFEPLSESDLPLIARWLQAPHVAQWWPDPDQLAKIESHMDEKNVRLFVVRAAQRPIGYLQCYDVPQGGHPFPDQPPGTRGIDQFIGETDMIGRGHGPALLRTFLDRLFNAGAPGVITDPDPANRRAVRAYEKAGFASDRLVDTPYGRTLLMVCRR